MEDQELATALDWDAAWVLQRLDRLAACSEEPGAVTRLFLTPQHAEAIEIVQAWMVQAGLVCRLDPSGTLVGSRAGATPDAPKLLIGSHIDTVRDAGRYDGCLGVVMGIALAARLRDTELPYGLEIRAFGDEEGVRFPVTLTGACAAAGRFDPAWLAVEDKHGETLGHALEGFGLDPNALAAGACTATGAFAYLEIHIEQGPVLESLGAPLGIVTAISGAVRFEATVTGHAGHAGTVPMDQRRDALVAASAMVLAVREIALAHPGAVATVGRLTVSPCAINVIPGACVFTIDLRAPDDTLREAAQHEILHALQTLAESGGVALTIEPLHAAPAVTCDSRLQALLAKSVAAQNLPAPHLPSGAGHDAMAMAALCPVGMLFLRCAGGISHHPDETVSESDVAAALDVMTLVLQSLDPADFATN